MKGVKKNLVILCLNVLIMSACSNGENFADCDTAPQGFPCSEQSEEEKARIALANGEYDEAIERLTKLAETKDEPFGLYTLIAAAYAAKAGIAILDLAKSSFTNKGSLQDQLSSFLPSPKDVDADLYESHLRDVESALAYLDAIPESSQEELSSKPYGPSAAFQRMLYGSCYAMMVLNKFVAATPTGDIDPEKLASMSDADAELIFSSLQDAAHAQGSAEISEKINATLEAVEAEPGASKKEKLQNYAKRTRSS